MTQELTMTATVFGKAAAFALATFIATGTATGAMAEQPWDHSHPRRAEVNHRLAVQDHRIDHERRDGQISRMEAMRLHGDDAHVRGEERFDARHDDGHITRGEQVALNRQENGISRQIGR
jgi:hypothetical protein